MSPIQHLMPKRRSNNHARKGPHPKGQAASAVRIDRARPKLAQRFSDMASRAAQLSGRPATFLAAVLSIVVWAICGPLFGFSDTWQLVINTSTTIITFLMVFLIQNTQNRDTLALQVKLSELVIAVEGAKNNVAAVEDMCEEDLERLHDVYRRRADETLDHLQDRRAAKHGD